MEPRPGFLQPAGYTRSSCHITHRQAERPRGITETRCESWISQLPTNNADKLVQTALKLALHPPLQSSRISHTFTVLTTVWWCAGTFFILAIHRGPVLGPQELTLNCSKPFTILHPVSYLFFLIKQNSEEKTENKCW